MHKSISMRKQITILFICLVTLPILLIYTVASHIFIQNSRQDLKIIYTANIQEMGTNLEGIFQNALELSQYPLMEQSLRTYLTADSTSANYMIFKQNASAMLDSIPYGYKTAIHDIGIHTEEGDSIISNNNVKLSQEDRSVLSQMETRPYWDYSSCAHSRDYIYLMRHLRNPSALSQYVGYIKLAIQSSALRTTMLNSRQNEQTSYFLLTPQSHLVTWIDDAHYLEYKEADFTYEQLQEKRALEGSSWLWENCLVSSYELENGLMLYSITQPEILTQVSHTFLTTMTILAILVFLFSLLLSPYFSRIITRPLKILGDHMTSLSQENFSVRAQIKGCSEITVLTEHFNQMAQRLEFLYNEVYMGELKWKQSQLKALQAQINPHFLYNTLDTIYWMSKMGETEQVSAMVSNLSQMMRTTLTPTSNDKIPLKKELEHLNCYIAIQQIRYGKKIQFLVTCPPHLEQLSVLCFLLQPLVENALVHGLSNCLSGIVKVHIFEEGPALIYEVSNNGTPIDEEDIHAILTSPERSLRGFALRNIGERIQLKYGKQYGLSCYRDQEFSTFRITQPKEKENSNDENITCG